MRATLFVSLVAVALPLAAQTPPSPPAPAPAPAPPPAPAAKRTVELTGLVLVYGFFTNARVNNSDVPQFADSLPSASAIGGTTRLTCLGLLVTGPHVLRRRRSRAGRGCVPGRQPPPAARAGVP